MEKIPYRYWTEHPIVQNMPRTLKSAYKISDFISQAELHRLEGLYHQFLRVVNCEDQMTLFLPQLKPQSGEVSQQADVVTIALNRSRRNFTDRDRLMLNLLRPHLSQIYDSLHHYHRIQQKFNPIASVHQSPGFDYSERNGADSIDYTLGKSMATNLLFIIRSG